MLRVRPVFLRGLTVFGLFLILIVASDLFLVYPVEQPGYTFVEMRWLEEHPLRFEGQEISSHTDILSVTDNGTFFTAKSAEGAILIFPDSVGQPQPGERVNFRGMSWIVTNGSILIHEFYVINQNISLIWSVPGIVLFLILFFFVFRIDFSRLAFVLRRDEHT